MITPAARRQFLKDYARIRVAEGRGAEDSAYYRALPFEDLCGRNAAQWRIRARTFPYFLRCILPKRRDDVLDLGAFSKSVKGRPTRSNHPRSFGMSKRACSHSDDRVLTFPRRRENVGRFAICN
jgi:hypothetical protein